MAVASTDAWNRDWSATSRQQHTVERDHLLAQLHHRALWWVPAIPQWPQTRHRILWHCHFKSKLENSSQFFPWNFHCLRNICTLAVQPGVARAFALRAELGRFAPAWSAQLCRFAITQPTDEQTPRRKIAHRWACIIAAFNLEKEAILISNGKRLNIMVFNISSEKSKEKTSINVKLQHIITLPFGFLPGATDHPTRSLRDRSTHT